MKPKKKTNLLDKLPCLLCRIKYARVCLNNGKCSDCSHIDGSFGLTGGQYRRLNQAQSKSCAICKEQTYLVGDHDHITEQPRGLLCTSCNSGLGLFKDSPELLEIAAKYIISYKRQLLEKSLEAFENHQKRN